MLLCITGMLRNQASEEEQQPYQQQVELLAMPSVRFRKTINTVDHRCECVDEACDPPMQRTTDHCCKRFCDTAGSV
jgi:hypothetical protein